MAQTTPNSALPYPEQTDPTNVPADMKALADALDAQLKSLQDQMTAMVMPATQRIYLGQNDIPIRTKSGADPGSFLPGYDLSLTNPHPTLMLRVQAIQRGWWLMGAFKGHDYDAAIYAEPLVQGTNKHIMGHSARNAMKNIEGSQKAQRFYMDYYSFWIVDIPAGATITSRARVWSSTSTARLIESGALSRYCQHAIIPMAWVEDSALLDLADPPDEPPEVNPSP